MRHNTKSPQFRRDKRQTCVYCGELTICTEDHVIPECLWPEKQRPTRTEYVLVPACKRCNGRKGLEDEYMRDVLSADIACDGNPIAMQIQANFFRAHAKNKSVFGRVAARTHRFDPVFSPGNIYLGHHPSVPIEWKRIEKFLRFVVRGLYWKLLKSRIPNDYEIEVFRIPSHHFDEQYRRQMGLGAIGPHGIKDGVFGSIMNIAKEDPFTTCWLMWFYEGVVFGAATLRSGAMEHYKRSIIVPQPDPIW